MSIQLRQGDVLLEKIATTGYDRGLLIKRVAKPVERENGLLILARGEATGHHHSVATKEAKLFINKNGVLYLSCDDVTEVVHQEHDPLVLTPGTYRVTTQQEYSPKAVPRPVAD